MHGQMQVLPLMISDILAFAAREHGDREIVSHSESGSHRYTYRDAEQRARRLASGLAGLGVVAGDRVATLAWNSFRHFEIYYGVPGMGAVCHTLNPRLFADQLAYVINHAGDSIICVDRDFLPMLEPLAAQLAATVRGIVVLCEAAEMPDTPLAEHFPIHCYETLVAEGDADYCWPRFDENTASSLCYTSGTTGNPKGVLYSHRSTLLHAFAANMKDAFAIGATDVVLPLIPMFHANAWSLPYTAAMAGAKLVFTSSSLINGEVVQQLMAREQVTFAAGVPTIWLSLLQYLEASGKRIDSVQRLQVGGAACPTSVMEAFWHHYGVATVHGWGMTELSPMGTINSPKAFMADMPVAEVIASQARQGRGLFGINMKIVDDAGGELPRDGQSRGRLLVRGHWVVDSYFRHDGGRVVDDQGWFDTGDVATIDPQGYMTITDRNKDVIKSGGEWISSIALENIAVAHPDVAEAAVIAVHHPKWDERPLLLVVPKPGRTPNPASVLALYAGKVASWWCPDAVELVAELPHTGTGKVLKTALREQYRDYRWPAP